MITFKKFTTYDFQFIILAFLPAAFVIGPLIVELIVNIIILFFIFNIVKNKNFYFLKDKIFVFLSIFYLILLYSHFNSLYFEETKLNVFFYFRFILFPFAVYEILKTNKKYLKYLFIVLLTTIFIVCFDGYVQFFFGKNLIGYEKYLEYRISGFFKNDLILGSYLSRLFPLLIGILIYFKDEKKLNIIGVLVASLCLILIFLSGERAALIKTIIGFIIIFLVININLKTKILVLFSFAFSIFLILSISPVIFDRYINQTKKHIYFSGEASNNKIILMKEYYPMYQTSLKMFNSSKIFGKGPKTYRYHCDDPDFITYFPLRNTLVDNTILKINLSWKDKGDIEVNEFFIKENDVINKDDKLFSYNFVGKNKKLIYFSDKEGVIKKIYKQQIYLRDTILLDLEPKNSPDQEIQKSSACNNHPHNFYFQLLAETGVLGFIYVLSLFLYISYLLIKNFFYYFINSSKKISDSELCLLVGFFLVLWPLTTNGNFFNNWINLINFYPLGIYLFLRNERMNG